ncbi:MAG: helical backbone metal receptor, partial [Anaerolineae bacterium]|nr:helical backbone metal receptor [Anaerolineae bacterium]
MTETLRVYCDPLGAFVDLPVKPQHIVSLASGLTEALVHMGYSDSIAGISSWCPNFVPHLRVSIIGDYLSVDEEQLRDIQPDLFLITTGVQRGLARKLLKQGIPVYVLPLPNSLHGILENVMALGALVDDMPAARALTQKWSRSFLDLESGALHPKPRIYTELWFGKHSRMTGGLTFVHDLIEAAGGENIFGHIRKGYLPLDLHEVQEMNPDIFLLYSEPQYPIDPAALQAERGWDFPIIQADIQPNHNLIHDGPSMMDTAKWL